MPIVVRDGMQYQLEGPNDVPSSGNLIGPIDTSSGNRIGGPDYQLQQNQNPFGFQGGGGGKVITPWVNKVTGETWNAPSLGYTNPDPNWGRVPVQLGTLDQLQTGGGQPFNTSAPTHRLEGPNDVPSSGNLIGPAFGPTHGGSAALGGWANQSPEFLSAPGYESYAPTAAFQYSPAGGTDVLGGYPAYGGGGGGGGGSSGGGGSDTSTLGGALSALSLLGGANSLSGLLTGKSLLEHAGIPNPLSGFLGSEGAQGIIGNTPLARIQNLFGAGPIADNAALTQALHPTGDIGNIAGLPFDGGLPAGTPAPPGNVLGTSEPWGSLAGSDPTAALSGAAPGIASGPGMLGGGGGMTSAQHAAFSNMGGGGGGGGGAGIGGLLGLSPGAAAFAVAAPLLAFQGITAMQADESPAETRAQQTQAGQVFNQAKDFIIEHGRVPGPEDGWHGNIDHLLRMMAPGGGGGISATVGADLQRFGNGVPNEVLGRAFTINDPEGNIVLNHLAQETDMIGVDPGVRALINSRNIDTTPSLAFEGRMRQDIENRFMYPEFHGAVTPYLQNAVGHDKQPLMETVYDEYGAEYLVPPSRPYDPLIDGI